MKMMLVRSSGLDLDVKNLLRFQMLKKEETFSKESLCARNVDFGGKIGMNQASPTSAGGMDTKPRQSELRMAVHGERLSAKITNQETCLQNSRTG